jgi:hypothetical protein
MRFDALEVHLVGSEIRNRPYVQLFSRNTTWKPSSGWNNKVVLKLVCENVFGFRWLGVGPSGGFCEQGFEWSCSDKSRKCVDYMSDWSQVAQSV